MRAEHHVLVALPGDPRQQISSSGFRGPGGVVLGDLQPHRPQFGRQGVGDLALLTGRAADLAKPDEGVVEPLVPRHRDRLAGAAARWLAGRER